MEDEHLALPAFVPRGAGNGAGVSLFGVFDGHGGRHCATFLKSARRSPARETSHTRRPGGVAKHRSGGWAAGIAARTAP